ncbi:MAG: HAD-superfamily hydrolase, subfamily variant 3 [Patescibacteria group bacterium]|nr:HAD-superfamily hydrolase, subfamily variant 3 [Patescibacteria group bacterium]
MGKSTIKAVIYDVDGTMVDSEPLHVKAWDESLRRQGAGLGQLSESFRATMAGKKPIAIATGMVEELGLPISAEVLLQDKSTIFMSLVRTSLKGMPGVVESIKRFHESGLILAIGTSLDRRYLDIVLSTLKVDGFFKVIVTGNEIKHGKPHPETYQTVARRLGLNPQECVVLEDAKSGIQSAKAAGCYCLAIKNPNALPQDTSEADKVLPTLDNISISLIESLAGLRA